MGWTGKRGVGAVWALSVLGLVRTAQGSEHYPADIARVTGAPCVPQCALCHWDNTGGPRRINNRFGRVIQRQGGLFPGENVPDAGVMATLSIEVALNQLAAANVNTDGDGGTDVEELSEGLHPAAAGAVTVCGPQYGCGARIAKPAQESNASVAAAVLTALAAAVVLLRRRRS